MRSTSSYTILMMISPTLVHVREGRRAGKCRESMEEIRNGNTDYGGMVQPSQQHVTPCVKGVKWGLGTRGLRMVAAISAGISVQITQEEAIVPRCRRAGTRTPL